MYALFYVRIIGFTAGALLHLFLLALIVGYRRPRAFERVLFLVVLALFLFYAGALLGVNADLHYVVPPRATLQFAIGLALGGLALLPPFLVHVHAEYYRVSRGGSWPGWLVTLVAAAYVPLAYFGPFVFPRLLWNPSLESFWPGAPVSALYGAWLGAAQVAATVFETGFARTTGTAANRGFHRAMIWFFGVVALVTIYTYLLGGPTDRTWSEALATGVMLSALVPSALLGYYIVRHNFLQIGVHRNLIYAVSAAFLALLYLAVVRRIGSWLEPFLPPEATAAILLFVLVVFFEPLQRRIGRALQSSLQSQVGRLQRLAGEIGQEARLGDLGSLVEFIEKRIRDEFDLTEVRLVLVDRQPDEALRPLGSLGHTVRVRLGKDEESLGLLETSSSGAPISADTFAALEFLSEQLPAAIDLCRLIEEKLKLERQLAERERLALVGQMAASISHNLRNPLSSMKTILQVQLENPRLPESLRTDCTLVVAEIDRLSAKLSQLLRYAKPSLRSGDDRQRVGAAALAERVVNLLGREAESRRSRSNSSVQARR